MTTTDTPVSPALDRLYAVLSGDDAEDRACQAIPDTACTALPRNFVFNVANGACTKLAEQLAGPNLVLPWLLAAMGAPAALVGYLAPIKQVGSLLPQLAVSGQIRRVARRKWFWVGAGATQAAVLLIMIPAVLVLPPLAAGLAILLLLALFSMASGVGSVAFQDVAGKTIPKGRRGRLLANRATIGGLLTLGAGVVMRLTLDEEAGITPFLWLIAVAAALWALGALIFAAIDEDPGATEGGRSAGRELKAGLGLARAQPGYRRYLTARAVLVTLEIAMPFYALHAHGLFGGALAALGGYVVAVGIANVISSPFWGFFSDLSSRKVMALSGVIGAAVGGLALGIDALPADWQTPWLYALVFLVLGIAMSGVRLGRKTYLVDGAPKDERPLYVAFANSFIGLVSLAAGSLGFIAQAFSIQVLIGVLAVLALAGAALSLAMPEADRMVDMPR